MHEGIDIINGMKTRRMESFGHFNRMNSNKITKLSFSNIPNYKRRKGSLRLMMYKRLEACWNQ
jgi:hypothetical protein